MATLAQFAADCGGVLHGEDRDYSSVCIDTRKLTAGELFVALRGPNFDANAFIAEAQKRGAAGAVAEVISSDGLPIILVDDGLAALQRAACSHRRRYAGTLIGVAGSNGKTTTKEMLASILARRAPTLATAGNLNNHIGVPLTLLRLETQHRHAVIEMGANHPGDVTELAGFAQPSIGLVTNAGAEHLEGFGSLEAAARAEGELFAALPADGVAVLNVDDPFAGLWRDMTVARIVTFGLGSKADFSARDIHTSSDRQGFATRFVMHTPQGMVDIELALAGKHNVINALGAAAAAVTAGATLEHVAAGLAAMRPVAGRLQWRGTTCGASLIDDSYNANPSSMQAAIDVLANQSARRWLVIGDMGELGDFAIEAHREAGRYARAHGVERLFAFGSLAALAAESFGTGATLHTEIEDLIAAVRAELASDVCLLVKGSRSNRLERLVQALSGTTAAGTH
jgi:UDP-N-acetylmuramoyl-tripeptide--D-alanyl-D-alanine ligase